MKYYEKLQRNRLDNVDEMENSRNKKDIEPDSRRNIKFEQTSNKEFELLKNKQKIFCPPHPNHAYTHEPWS